MALTQVLILSKIEYDTVGVVYVRTQNVVKDGSEIVSRGKYFRHCIKPGQDYTQELPEVKAICQAVHTPEKIAAYNALVQGE